MSGKNLKHTGSYSYHDDDCWCMMGDNYCNRDGFVWSCCGACKKDSECSGAIMHPTYWKHPKFSQTVKEYANGKPVYKSNEEIRKIAPKCFDKI
jgi:hypothetical protein